MPTTLSTNLVTSLASPPDVTQTYFDRVLLSRAKYYMYHSRWAATRSLKHKQGKNIIFRRYAHLAIAIGALNESVPPSGKVPVNTDFTALLSQFGDVVVVSDLTEMTQADPVMNEFYELIGVQAGISMDTVERDVAVAGTSNIIYSNGTARTSLNTIIESNDCDRLIRSMMNSGARTPIGPITGVGNAMGGYPQMPAYPVIIHPNVYFDLQNVSGFSSREKYAGAMASDLLGDEVGRYRQLAFFVAPDPDTLGAGARVITSGGAASTLVDNTSGTTDVYLCQAFGEDYFTTVPLDGESTRTITKGLGSAGTSDPLEQLQTMGWKNTSARLRTNEAWGGRIECGAGL